MLSELRSSSYLSNPEANTGSKISTKGNPQISHIIRETSKAKLEVSIIKASILVIFLMCSRMHSTALLGLVGAIMNRFCTRIGSICQILAEIEVSKNARKSSQ